MNRIALIVEGKGDVRAAPNLIARCSAAFGGGAYSVNPPIRAGGARRLRRNGELERFLIMAITRHDIDGVLVLLDLEDDCPRIYHEEFFGRSRVISEKFGKPVEFCFCVREFESWFLADIDSIIERYPEYQWKYDKSRNYLAIRGAKEALSDALAGRGYRQTRDQLPFARAIDIKRLAVKDRSFRKMVKAVTGLNYEDILLECEI